MKLPNDEIVHYKSNDGVTCIVERTELVRCKDCMWGNNKTRSGKRYCELSDMYEVDDGFCNWGEKIK